MSDVILIAEFPFVTNKSFAGDSHPITIPARYHQGLKECGLIDSARAKINFRKVSTIEGSIRVGWRAGGRYYQIKMSKTRKIDAIAAKVGTTLAVRVLKTSEDWLVEIA